MTKYPPLDLTKHPIQKRNIPKNNVLVCPMCHAILGINKEDAENTNKGIVVISPIYAFDTARSDSMKLTSEPTEAIGPLRHTAVKIMPIVKATIFLLSII